MVLPDLSRTLQELHTALQALEDTYEGVFWSHHTNAVLYLEDMIKIAEMCASVDPCNTRSEMGHTLLHLAVFCDNEAAVLMLLKLGADVNEVYKGMGGRQLTPLHVALRRTGENMLDVVQHLVDAQVHSGKPHQGSVPWLPSCKTSLHSEDFARLLTLLHKAGIDFNAVDTQDGAPLHVAASTGNSYLANQLLGFGASIDVTDTKGQTPLHMALRRGNMNVAQLLLQAGANTHIKDNNGNVPGDMFWDYMCLGFDADSYLHTSGYDAQDNGARLVARRLFKFVTDDPDEVIDIKNEATPEPDPLQNRSKRQRGCCRDEAS